MKANDDVNGLPPLAEFPLLPRNSIERRDPAKRICGDCRFYQHGPNVGEGTCHGNPPGLMFTSKGPLAVRPAIALSDRACRFFEKETS
jgi:hypothetical protein